MARKMKIIAILMINFLLTGTLQVFADTPKGPNINAVSYIAIDAGSGAVLCEKNSKKILAMASTTKIMTCLIALEYCDMKEVVTVSSKAATTYGSKVHLRTGEKITVEELLYGLMMKSGNDAAVALAEHIGGDVEGFSVIMNDYALKLGLLSSNFKTPHGLDRENHYSTSYDLAKVTSVAMKNLTFRNIVKCKSIGAAEKGFNRSYNNINKILHRLPNATGVKTGYTGNAGKCLVSAFRYMGRDIIIVTLNCPNRWNETVRIANYVTGNYEVRKLYDKGEKIGEVKCENSCNVGEAICSREIVVPVKKNVQPDVNIRISKDITAPISQGDVIGSLEISSEGIKLYEEPLVLKGNINKHSKLKIFLNNKFKKN